MFITLSFTARKLLNRKMASIGKGAIFLILFILWCSYVIIGILVFKAVENSAEREDYSYRREWNYGDSFWFVVVLLTTIGKKRKQA